MKIELEFIFNVKKKQSFCRLKPLLLVISDVIQHFVDIKQLSFTIVYKYNITGIIRRYLANYNIYYRKN